MKPKTLKTTARKPGPQTRDDVIEAIACIGRDQRALVRIEAEMNDELARVKQKYEDQAQPHNEAIAELTEGVHTWCEANRVVLTDNGKSKTANLPSGQVRWRTTPPGVSIKTVDKVIEQLRSLGLGRFLRVKTEIDKEAILAEPEAVEAIKNIKITQREEFVIEPFESQLERAA